MAANTWLVFSFLFILAEGRYHEVQKDERQAPSPGDTNQGCHDVIPNCQDYIDHDSTICSSDSPYFDWTTTHCQASCAVCQGGPTTTPPPCLDELDYCDTFDIPKACLDFPKWASQKCRQTCGICQGGPTTTQPLCVDTLNTCSSFHIPHDCMAYPKWAAEKCRNTCKVCQILEPPTVRPPSLGKK
ncbi:uncharacterized protein LOC117341058 [Pecten maximus]|uniref:uncharacterized protein LOC117341058 n=1 Tax=Pecten maximus TaxID=6579 RepID=UPI0014580831|nr:uncharacterized protein LOC117341058 [Pecten maximus]